MKLWNRLMLVGLVLALAMSLFVTTASAQTSKKKKKTVATAVATPVAKKKAVAPVKKIVTGTNLEGRSGLFYGDTSSVAPKDVVEGSIHVIAELGTDTNFLFPVGGHYGLGDNLEVSAGVKPWINSYTTPGTPAIVIGGVTLYPAVAGKTYTNSDLIINGGAKYAIPATNREMPDFSIGGQVYIPTYTGGVFVVQPYGTVTYVLHNGLLLNGEFGIGICSATYVVFDGGVAYPITPKITVIGEIGANQGGFGYADSELAGGARFDIGGDAKVQALIGVPFNGGGVVLGAGLILASR